MTEIDARRAITDWYSDHLARWKDQGIDPAVRLSDDPGVNKAGAALETPSHVASVTVWGNGMIEFIVLDVRGQRDVVRWDREYSDAGQLRGLLDECAELFEELTGKG